MVAAVNRKSIPAVYAIERHPAPLAGAEVPKRVADRITALAHAQFLDLVGHSEGAKTAAHQIHFAPAAAPGSAFAGQLRHHISSLPMTPLRFEVNVGTRIISPPYDHNWAAGGGSPTSRWDGDLRIITTADGFSANGVSIMLSSPTPVSVAVKPMGTYEFDLIATKSIPQLRSRGGLGLLVYRNANPAPLVEHQSILWNLIGVDLGVLPVMMKQGTGEFADAVSSMTDFGPIRMAPVLFDMIPGDFYEVWMWCWCVGQNQTDAMYSVLACEMPGVLVTAGPPTIIK